MLIILTDCHLFVNTFLNISFITTHPPISLYTLNNAVFVADTGFIRAYVDSIDYWWVPIGQGRWSSVLPPVC